MKTIANDYKANSCIHCFAGPQNFQTRYTHLFFSQVFPKAGVYLGKGVANKNINERKDGDQ